MATRALGAEIRHDHTRFVRLLEATLGIPALGGFQSVQCEASERVDLELIFGGSEQGAKTKVGIEAKFDHALTEEQVKRQLGVVDKLVVLLPNMEFAPLWLANIDSVGVITWAEAIGCFVGSRLTVDDIESMPLTKSTVENSFRALSIVTNPPPGWTVDVRRGGGGMPAIVIESPALPNGRTLRGQIQVAGRGMPANGAPVRLEYTIGVSVENSAAEYPDPASPHATPGWIPSLLALHTEILDGAEGDLLVSKHAPGKGGSEFGKHKVALAKKYLPHATWLAKGYADGWALGIKSSKVTLNQLDDLASIANEVITRWFDLEVKRQSTGN